VLQILAFYCFVFSRTLYMAFPHVRHGTGTGSPYAMLQYAVWCVGVRGACGLVFHDTALYCIERKNDMANNSLWFRCAWSALLTYSW